MKCKNCGAPIEKRNGFGYWRHVREIGPGRIWCRPNAQEGDEDFTDQAETE